MLNKFFELLASLFNQKTNVKPVSNPIISPEVALDQVANLETNIYHSIPEKISIVTGDQFIANNLNLGGAVREENILKEFVNGNVPDFLRKFVPVTVTSGTNKITYYVSTDYLSIGDDSNYCRMPMNPLTAQKIADLYGCILPTKKMVDDIYKNADIKLQAKPFGSPYDSSMQSTERFQWSNNSINKQLFGKNINLLVAGHKKDVVITNKLYPANIQKKVAIYGWWLNPNSAPIQTLNATSHDYMYCDYSHGIRLISGIATLNDKIMNISDILTDTKLCNLLSDEGVLKLIRY